MSRLNYIEDYDSFIEGHLLTEGLTDGSQSVCNQAFINGGIIRFSDGSSVHPKDIVKVVDDAIMYLADEFTRTFRFATRINIIYLRESNRIRTMAVDENMNLYMNAGFIYHTLKMDKILVGAVIMHEVFHVLFNHIERGKNWLGAKGKADNDQTRHDNNLAADVEVNQTLVRLEIIDEETLTNTINGIYLKNAGGQFGSKTNVVPMEIILDNEEYMNKLRAMCPPPIDPNAEKKDKIKTTDEWNKGYKEGWNKIAEIIKKHGYKDAWDKLQRAGIVDGDGQLVLSKNIDDIMKIELLQVKSMDEYLNESLKVDESDKGKTYDDGFINGAKKLIEKLRNAVQSGNQDSSGEGMDGGSQSQEDEYESNLDKNELEKVDLPSGENNGKGKSGDDNLDNTSSDNKSNDDNQGEGSGSGESDDSESKSSDGDGDGNQGGAQSGNSSNKKKAGKGGNGKSDDDVTDDDMNKLADDLKKKSQLKSSKGDPGAIGGTGSFIESSEFDDEILKESGYTQEDIDSINEIRQRNKERNSQKGIEKARDEIRRNARNSDPIKKYLDAIEVESAKYKNVWKDIMQEFLADRTRRAGTQKNDTSINWKRKTRIALGQVGPQYQKVDQDPQDVNVYVDVSGSVDVELLEVISKSLVIFSQQYKYSGINICPWASTTNGIHKVDDFNRRTEEEITNEILQIVSKGISQCGGGTEAKAVIAAMIDVIVDNLNDHKKKRKDDVHVVITDGYFDYTNIENNIKMAVSKATDRDDAAEKAPAHTFWMIYDAPEDLQNRWKNEIKLGKLIFINSETVKGNK